MRDPAVCIMASGRNGIVSVGVASDLPQRAFPHRGGAMPGFTARYDCKTLV